MLYDRHLVRNRAIATTEVHRPHTCDGIGEVFRLNLEREIAPIEAVMSKGLLNHVLGRILRDRLAEDRHQFLLEVPFF